MLDGESKMCVLYRKTYMLVKVKCVYIEKHVSESKMCVYRKTYMSVKVKCVYIEKQKC